MSFKSWCCHRSNSPPTPTHTPASVEKRPWRLGSRKSIIWPRFWQNLVNTYLCQREEQTRRYCQGFYLCIRQLSIHYTSIFQPTSTVFPQVYATTELSVQMYRYPPASPSAGRGGGYGVNSWASSQISRGGVIPQMSATQLPTCLSATGAEGLCPCTHVYMCVSYIHAKRHTFINI